VQGVGDDCAREGVAIGIEGTVSSAFEVGSKDAGPGVGENAEREMLRRMVRAVSRRRSFRLVFI